MIDFSHLTNDEALALDSVFRAAKREFIQNPRPRIGTIDAGRNKQLAEWIDELAKRKSCETKAR